MPARKTTKAGAKKSVYKPSGPIVALYAVPIYEAIKRGDLAEMKKLAAQARKHVSDVTTALAALDKQLALKKK